MRITYEFDNGDTVTIEVEDTIGKWIVSSRLKESADAERHVRWCERGYKLAPTRFFDMRGILYEGSARHLLWDLKSHEGEKCRSQVAEPSAI